MLHGARLASSKFLNKHKVEAAYSHTSCVLAGRLVLVCIHVRRATLREFPNFYLSDRTRVEKRKPGALKVSHLFVSCDASA